MGKRVIQCCSLLPGTVPALPFGHSGPRLMNDTSLCTTVHLTARTAFNAIVCIVGLDNFRAPASCYLSGEVIWDRSVSKLWNLIAEKVNAGRRGDRAGRNWILRAAVQSPVRWSRLSALRSAKVELFVREALLFTPGSN